MFHHSKKLKGIERIKRRYGYYFVAPWLVGAAIFLIIPIFLSVYYSFSDIKITAEGVTPSFVGVKWYRYALVEDPDFIDIAASSLTSLLTSLPIIMVLSLVIALVLNQDFKGRTLARSVFFLPVIIGSGVVMTILSGYTMTEELTNSMGDGTQVAEYMQIIDFKEILIRLNFPSQISSLMENYLSDIFNLIWSCGIQILLFVAGLQTIPAQLYEVSRVEGASAWENFWYITVPMLGQTILLVGFYTMIDLFVEKSKLVSRAIGFLGEQVYDRSSAMLWLYFTAVAIVMGMVVFLYKKLCLDRWNA